MSEDTKFAHLGKPGSAFSAGFARRLNLMLDVVDFREKKILDAGCGEGVWLEQFVKFTPRENVFGSDIDPESVALARQNSHLKDENIVVSPGEKLPWADAFFDIVFSNEVLEHVNDDHQCVVEAIRVLRSGGKFIVFTPNRGWPFETHGMFRGGKYYWGNVFLLPWMPKSIRQKYSYHVRNYSNRDLEKLFVGLPVKITYHRHIFPGFDGLSRKFGFLGKLFQMFFWAIEKTPLHFFGISHFLIAEKI